MKSLFGLIMLTDLDLCILSLWLIGGFKAKSDFLLAVVLSSAGLFIPIF